MKVCVTNDNVEAIPGHVLPKVGHLRHQFQAQMGDKLAHSGARNGKANVE